MVEIHRQGEQLDHIERGLDHVSVGVMCSEEVV